jgi:hypothetical protein
LLAGVKTVHTRRVKTCNTCKQTLPLESFYTHPRTADGYLPKCKACHKAFIKAARAAKPDHYRAYELKRGQTTKRKRQKRKSLQRYRETNPIHVKAHNAVARALRSGRLKRSPVCEQCAKPDKPTKSERLHAHHEDHTKPLEVRWLCPRCHNGN